MNAAAERFLAAQEALLEALGRDDDGGAFRRASARLEGAFGELRAGPEPVGPVLTRMRTLAGLIQARATARRADVGRELGRTRLALELVQKRSIGSRPGRRFDVSG